MHSIQDFELSKIILVPAQKKRDQKAQVDIDLVTGCISGGRCILFLSSD